MKGIQQIKAMLLVLELKSTKYTRVGYCTLMTAVLNFYIPNSLAKKCGGRH